MFFIVQKYLTTDNTTSFALFDIKIFLIKYIDKKRHIRQLILIFNVKMSTSKTDDDSNVVNENISLLRNEDDDVDDGGEDVKSEDEYDVTKKIVLHVYNDESKEFTSLTTYHGMVCFIINETNQ